jgi:short-subunit dehydrogenase
MIEQNKGHVVTVASMASYLATCNLVDYCCTKAGVLALHQGMNSSPHRSSPLAKNPDFTYMLNTVLQA